jgi:subtilase family serine protease
MKKRAFRIAGCVVALFLSIASMMAAERRTLSTRVPDAAKSQRLFHLPSDTRLQLAIGVPLRNQDALTNLLQRVYTQGDVNFHHYLTPDQFVEQFGPTKEDYQKVIDYAKSNHLEVLRGYRNRGVVDVAGNSGDIERMFHVTMGIYQHPTENREFHAPDVAPSVDANMPVSFVVGLDDYVKPRANIHRHAEKKPGDSPENSQPGINNGTGNGGNYLGTDFRNAYVPGVNNLKGSGQTVGLVEYVGYNESDIAKYESLAKLPDTPLLPIVLPGAVNEPCVGCSDNDNREVALDIEMVIAMAPDLADVMIVIGTTDADTMNELAAPTNDIPPPSQVSSSWTSTLDNSCQPALLQMAMQGQTVFLCSFDAGAPTNGLQSSATTENLLTMVGGTELSMTNPGVAWSGETVWSSSTGYIETALAIPYYQKAVNTTLNGGSSVYRNVPDVAGCADYIETVHTETFTNKAADTGLVDTSDGTSAAAPMWAAFIALVNQEARSEGQPTVGFINPALYSIAQSVNYTNCFHDITVGNNTNTWSANLFHAGTGYDNCTGLGSPNGINMINALLRLSNPVFVNFNYTGKPQNGLYYTPYETLTQGVNAVSNYGTIFIETDDSSSETLTITKPMTITASDGTDTVGN